MEELDISILKYLALSRKYDNINRIAHYLNILKSSVEISLKKLVSEGYIILRGDERVKKKTSKIVIEMIMAKAGLKIPDYYEKEEKTYKISQSGLRKLKEV
ncbi:MAG: hypothetical protein ACFFDB_00070 [Promethearchaeota archaeon]